jgi:hypothetical protein
MRMRQIPANASSVGHPGLALQFAEPSRGQDEIGHIFRSMRSAMNVSRQTIARRLATSTSTIDSFEAGALPALPHWKETARIVRGYCELLRIDPEPLLWRMREQLNAQTNQAPPNGAARPPRSQVAPWARTRPAAPAVRPEKVPAPARRRTVRTMFAASAPIAIAVGVAILTQVAPGAIYRAVGLLPGLIGSPARAGLDRVMLLTAPTREGLRWIEVGDPRLRKADKLQTSTR